ncbi:MAG: primosomal protein N' [Oscillospiraceae bacterium]|nr:primosomal protein N' [Oscillospiraceae bacterium]
MQTAKVAQVAVEHTTVGFDKAFDYLVPEALAAAIVPGCRVLAPFGAGNKKRQGFVLGVREIASAPKAKLKTIAAVLDKAPLFNLEMLELCFWLQEKTFCTLFEAAKAMLPPGLCLTVTETYIISPDSDSAVVQALPEDERAVCVLLAKRGVYVKRERIEKALSLKEGDDVFFRLLEKGLILSGESAQQKVSDAVERMAELADPAGNIDDLLPSLTQKQQAVLRVLRDAGSAEVKEACYLAGVTPAVLATLQKKGIVHIFEKTAFRTPALKYAAEAPSREITLSPSQQKCFDSLKTEYYNKTGRPSLLFGVTGSGKTSVYLKMIDEALQNEGGVIVMVPEIALTPQTLSIFYSRYQNNVAVFHSGLSVGERMDEWRRVKSGEVRIAVGTRSAVFAPFKKLSLVILDEEQEHTYKSENSPRYHARDVARFRCAYNKALLVLASATPSIPSYAQALAGNYNLCELPERFGEAELPEVVVVDMSQKQNRGSAVSSTLFQLIEENLQNKRQSILLINRRGHNTFVACTACKHVITCPSCSISLIYHSTNNRLMCHYCGYSAPLPEVCPECGEETLRYSGYGTQRVESELHGLFPEARILRMDADTTQSRYAYDEKFTAFANGKYDIMLGTQMVAKGLDFPNVTLVGVISVDQQLYNDDYMSMEKTFALLTQVVGRSGRGHMAGKAVLQTLIPENEIIGLAARQDYRSFYNMEINLRRGMIYPPFCDMCMVVFVGEDEGTVKKGANWFLDALKELNSGEFSDQKLIVLGPLPLRVAKVSNKYRYRLIIKCKNTSRFREFMKKLLVAFGKERAFAKVTAVADINPERTN